MMNVRNVFRSSAAAVLMLAGAGSAVAGPVVWDASGGGNGNSYEVVVDNTINWDAAEAAAEAGGGYLATINSQAEQTFVESILTAANPATGSYWFGLRETATEGVFAYQTDEPVTYNHWLTGEPNNAQGTENAGAILWTADGGDAALIARRGGWNDEPTTGYPTLGVPTPAQADVLRGGYIVERVADTGSGGGDDGGGTPNSVPIPAAALTFPLGAAFAGLFYRRMKHA